jgi:hypothetical protein
MLDGKKAVGANLSWFNSELAGSLVEEKAGAPDMTGRAHAHGQHILAGWF